MSEINITPEDDYMNQMEQFEMNKREGINAWAEAVVHMLPDVDPDKAILIREGLIASLAGPPKFNPPPMTIPSQFGPQVDAEFIEPPNPIFEEFDEQNGITRVWDWNSIAVESTHAERGTDTVRLFRFEDVLITLHGEAAAAFWTWQETMRRLQYNNNGPVMIRSRRHRRRNPRPRKESV